MNNNYEPIAIIGIGCRFPGRVSSPDDLWNLLINRVDGIIEIPKKRWDQRRFYDSDIDKPGKMYIKQAGFLQEDITRFDPLFFGISPREAPNIDPQQRLLLEVTYEAIEDAGLKVEALQGADIGTFIGGFFLDWKTMQLNPYNREVLNIHTAVGLSMAMLSNRIAYTFDLRGPAVSIDTACSSSLIAAHYACQSIWNRESSMAIVGGVNLILKPETVITMTKGRFLSKHGRSKAFDVDAAGYARGEGAAVIILKPYQKALEDKDPIYALIKATGANQDGKTPGITVPNSFSQEALIRKVYKQANIDINAINYIEAHGTGTQAGDQAEMKALNTIFSEARSNGNKVLVGSIKTNIGHTEAVAGVAGIIKAALCLKHKKVPPNLHFSTPNPKINYEKLCLKVATQIEELPKEQISYASVNSFGYGGTNAHALLQEYPQIITEAESTCESTFEEDESLEQKKKPFVFPITARSDEALEELSKLYAEYIQNEQPDIRDLLYTSVFRRSHHQNRLAIIAESTDQLAKQLEFFSQGQLLPGMSANQAHMNEQPKIVFVFTGMGPQWWAMGRELMEKEPVFRQTIEECDHIFRRYAGWSILEELLKDEHSSRIEETQVSQPANFVIQAALTELWKTYGIEPDAVVGHSVGEVTVSYVSGALSLEDAILVSFHRSRLQQTLAGQGKLLAVGMSEAKVRELLKNFQNVSIAAINSPNSVTLAGKEEVLQKIAKVLEFKQIFNRMLRVDIPYHSYLMDPIEAEVLECLKLISPKSEKVPVYSTAKAEQIPGTDFGAQYWWHNIRQPVQFARTVETILNDGYTIFLEVGPHPVLRTSLQECLQANGKQGQILSSMKRKEPELFNFYETLGTLYTLGVDINWQRISTGGKYIKLPQYPWQKDSYWNESESSRQDRLGLSGHIFCNMKLATPRPAYEVELNTLFFPYLRDHCVKNMVVFPGAGYLEAGIALYYQEVGEDTICHLENVEFRNMLVIDENRVQTLHLTYDTQTKKYAVYSKFKEESAEWIQHATGKILEEPLTKDQKRLSIDELKEHCTQHISVEQFYDKLDRAGLHYLPFFRTVREIHKGEREIIARIEGHESLSTNTDTYFLHPTILDGGIQTLAAFFDKLVVPTKIDRLTYYSSPGYSCWAYLKLGHITEHSIKGDLCLLDEDGRICAELQNLECQRIVKDGTEQEQALSTWFYDVIWQDTELPVPVEAQGKWLIFTDENNTATQLIELLTSQNVDFTLISPGNKYEKVAQRHIYVPYDNLTDIERIISDPDNIPIKHIVYLLSQGTETYGIDKLKVTDVIDQCMPVVYIAQSLAKIQAGEDVKFSVITRYAQIVKQVDTPDSQANINMDLASTPLWGLGRLISNEHPNIKAKLIDIDTNTLENGLQLLVNELLLDNSDEDVAYRSGKRFVKRLEHTSLRESEEEKALRKVFTNTTPVELTVGAPGKIESLHYREAVRKEPEEGELEVEVHSVPLNFKDVMKVLGQIPPNILEDTYLENSIGLVCSGIVSRVGKDVTSYRVGDEVIASTPKGNFKSYITVKQDGYILTKPSGLRLEEAPIVVSFMTVIYGLGHIALLKKGEKILIHNASEAVGLAAIQYALWKGAEIFATAGNPEKRAYLKSLGIQHVMDSRTLEFANTIHEVTHGYGIDVVISDLSGEALQQSLSLLAPFGRFIKIEIGKKDTTENADLPMHVFNKNITFAAIDIDRLINQRKQLVKQLCQEVVKGFEEGYFSPLPVTTFPAAKAVDASTYLADRKHIGEVVINFHEQEVEIPIPKISTAIKPESTYLITGGTKGFGLEIARWLSSKGADHLVLISRSGAKTKEAKNTIAYMEQQGIHILATAVNVSNEQEVLDLIKQISTTMPSLRGIFHGAMVLDDGLLVDMNKERFTNVMMPKIAGALHLHKHTRHIPLDFFISFSSISSLIGNPGQANYVAANAFLDTFAYVRKAQGLPTTTVNLGVLGEVGVAARNSDVKSLLEGSGIRGFTNEEILQALDIVIKQKPIQVGLFDVDWNLWAKHNPEAATSSRFKKLVSMGKAGNIISEKMQQFMDEMAGMSKQEQHEHVKTTLCKELANILRLPIDKIEHDKPLMEQGIDSLMTVEFKNRLNNVFGAAIPETFLFAYPTVDKLTNYILDKILPSDDNLQIEDEEELTSDVLKEFNELLEQLDEE